MAGREFFLWQVRSFTVRVNLDFVGALNAALADPRNKSNTEMGGILVGRELSPNEIEISGFEFFDSGHRRGVIYSLGLREQLSLAERAARLSRKSGRKAVGFFRTHLRRGLFLDQDDFSLMHEAFGDPSQIALLIRPADPGPANAGVFVWEEGDIDRRQTGVFPFDAETLRAQGPTETEAAPQPRQRPVRAPLKLPTIPTIPVRWLAWGAATAAGALALGAVLPKLQLRPTVHHPARAIPVKTVRPAPVQVAKAEALPLPIFAPPKPDEGRSDVQPVEPVDVKAVEKTYARVFQPPKPIPEAEPKSVIAAVAPPPIIPVVPVLVAEKVAEPIPEPALPAPPRPEPPVVRKPGVQVAVSVEARESSELTKVVGHVPLFGHLAHAEGGKEFSPARPDSSIEPRVPASLASDLSGTLAVDVRLSIDKNGAVTNYEVLHGGGTQFASLAVSTAGNAAWEPARQGDHRVNSDIILHYRFQTR